jgi:hypothetical protein
MVGMPSARPTMPTRRPALLEWAWISMGRSRRTTSVRRTRAGPSPRDGSRSATKAATGTPDRASEWLISHAGSQATTTSHPRRRRPVATSRTYTGTPPETGWKTWRTRRATAHPWLSRYWCADSHHKIGAEPPWRIVENAYVDGRTQSSAPIEHWAPASSIAAFNVEADLLRQVHRPPDTATRLPVDLRFAAR